MHKCVIILSMDFKNKIVNDLFSRDFTLKNHAAKELIENKDTEAFSILCENAPYIFEFLKEKATKILVDNVNVNNFENIFAFMKIYSADFEDFITASLVKFANEDLTDKIYELFENGTDEEKAYCAKYFYFVNDTIALDILNKYAYSKFEPLAYNCAKTLNKFNDKTLYKAAIIDLKSDKEDYDKMDCVNFLVAYNDKNAFLPIFEFMKKTCFENEVAINLLDLKSFEEMLKDGQSACAMDIFDRILSAYPELLHLNTVSSYEIFDFIKFLANEKSPYALRLLLKAKIKFDLFKKENIYTFDLDETEKRTVNDIAYFLNTYFSKNMQNNFLNSEIFNKDVYRAIEALNVIGELNLEKYGKSILKLIELSENSLLISEATRTLKRFDEFKVLQIDKILEKISDENLKILTQSYF